MNRFLLGIVLVGLAAPAGRAAAEEDRAAPPDSIAAGAESGALLPVSLSARVGDAAALVVGYGGYDSGHQTARFEATTEVRAWGPIALRGGTVYTSNGNTLRPMFGARAQFLAQREHGFDASIGVFYKPEGFTEPEGEIETVLAVARRFGRVTAIVNLVYGQDAEGTERDGEVRFALLYPLSGRAQIGLDSRLRVDLGGPSMPAAKPNDELDLIAGPTCSYALGGVALLGQAGLSVVGATRTGVVVLAGLGTAF